jgi:shikimate dehydrogenase
LYSLKKEGVDPEGKNILILGAGGAAKAITYALLKFRCNIYIWGRTPSRISEFVKLYYSDSGGRVMRMDERLLGKYDFIINCTPVGQYPYTGETAISRRDMEGASFVFDAVYNPEETLLLSYARDLGIKHRGGRDMLIFQAYGAQRIWQERDLTDSVLYDTIEKIKTAIAGKGDQN